MYIKHMMRREREQLLEKLDSNTITSEDMLFADVPTKSESLTLTTRQTQTDMNVIVNDLEKRIKYLETKLSDVLGKLNEIDDIILDVAITKNEEAITVE